MMNEDHLGSIDNALEHNESPEEFDDMGVAMVKLVSVDKKKGDTAIELSYPIPRAYALIEDPG